MQGEEGRYSTNEGQRNRSLFMLQWQRGCWEGKTAGGATVFMEQGQRDDVSWEKRPYK